MLNSEKQEVNSTGIFAFQLRVEEFLDGGCPDLLYLA